MQFVVISGDDPRLEKFEYCDKYSNVLVQVTSSGEVIRFINSDGGEPEDQSFLRDWSWVVDELNALADKIESLELKIAKFEKSSHEDLCR